MLERRTEDGMRVSLFNRSTQQNKNIDITFSKNHHHLQTINKYEIRSSGVPNKTNHAKSAPRILEGGLTRFQQGSNETPTRRQTINVVKSENEMHG